MEFNATCALGRFKTLESGRQKVGINNKRKLNETEKKKENESLGGEKKNIEK
jgi:hypothetical protein